MGSCAFRTQWQSETLSYQIEMKFQQLVAARRSHRRFSGEEIDPTQVQLLLRAALMAPTSRNRQSWQFVVVEDKSDLEKLADVKENGSAFLKDAPLAIVVLGDPVADDCWVEDDSIAAASMLYQAEALGLGACWVQIRGRRLSDGTTSTEVVRGILDIPDSLEVLCIVAFGRPAVQLPPRDEDSLKWEKVHINKYTGND